MVFTLERLNKILGHIGLIVYIELAGDKVEGAFVFNDKPTKIIISSLTDARRKGLVT